MEKQREIEFRTRHGALQGKQNGMTFWIREDRIAGKLDYFVVIFWGGKEPNHVSTGGRRSFDLAGAKEFCQQIAAGEIKVEDLLAEFAAEDRAKEQAAIREVTERAKAFQSRLDAAGLKYTDLLELEVLVHALGETGHQILLGVELGKGWPDGS